MRKQVTHRPLSPASVTLHDRQGSSGVAACKAGGAACVRTTELQPPDSRPWAQHTKLEAAIDTANAMPVLCRLRGASVGAGTTGIGGSGRCRRPTLIRFAQHDSTAPGAATAGNLRALQPTVLFVLAEQPICLAAAPSFPAPAAAHSKRA